MAWQRPSRRGGGGSGAAVRSLPLLSPPLPLCSTSAQPRPPPRLLGKFSIRAAGAGDARAAASRGRGGKGAGARDCGAEQTGARGPGGGVRTRTHHAHAHTRMHTYARPAQLHCGGPRGPAGLAAEPAPAGTAARPRAVGGPAFPSAGDRQRRAEPRAPPGRRGAARERFCLSPGVALLSILGSRLASSPLSPSPHLRRPRGGGIFREEDFCLHVMLEVALFARRKAGREAQSAEKPCARISSSAFVHRAAFEQLAGGGRSLPGRHIPTVSAGWRWLAQPSTWRPSWKCGEERDGGAQYHQHPAGSRPTWGAGPSGSLELLRLPQTNGPSQPLPCP